ncbi:MAG TPA: BadF/BadG/BcrA/BcrD ATPase family protein [Bacillota bacterium]|nr:BadF/BadG/BcrA/BcrD ATPase family protein [Bacillota bacterium]
MGLVIAIDAGGTKTDCLIGTTQGEILAKSVSGPANYQLVGIDGVLRVISELLRATDDYWSHERHGFEVMWIGIAGVDRPGEREQVAMSLRNLGAASKVIVDNDAMIALASGTMGKPGIVVIAGTGSIAFGVNGEGKRTRAGGWGYILGDEGSAYYIGHSALNQVTRAQDGRGQPTLLAQAIIDHFGIDSIDGLVGLAYTGKLDRIDIAGLSPLVAEAAKEGDETACRILDSAGAELGIAAGAVAKALNMERSAFPCVTTGGVFKSGKAVTYALMRELAKVAPMSHLVEPEFPPVVGAYFMGIRELGQEIDEDVRERARTSLAGLKFSASCLEED